MEVKEYRGKVVQLVYPHFLEIQEKEPKWWALGPKGTTVQLFVDPPEELASIFAESIRNPYFARSPGVFIEREGDFKSARIKGYERLARLRLPNSSVESVSWWIDGKLQSRNLLNVEINAVASEWHNGAIWTAFIDSITVVGDISGELSPEALVSPEGLPLIVKSPSRENEGVLVELPHDLQYLVDVAVEIGSLPTEALEENPEFTKILERHLRREMHGFAPKKARARIQADRQRLAAWFQLHPADKYPETAKLCIVAGALLYADKIFRMNS